jgi:glycosyltransferase involved in cell wall biosynthesis
MIFCQKIFYVSPFSFFANTKKSLPMPAGINTTLFKKDDRVIKKDLSILYLGRISPVKNLEILIKAFAIVYKQNQQFTLNIVGVPGEKDYKYYENIKKIVHDLNLENQIKFIGQVPNYKTPEIYNQHEIFVNMTNSGSFDKTSLEAMACEGLAVVCNRAFEKIFPKEWQSVLLFKEGDEKDLAEKISRLMNLPTDKKEQIRKRSREIVIREHSLDRLVNKVINSI